jgi:hypothetical protein
MRRHTGLRPNYHISCRPSLHPGVHAAATGPIGVKEKVFSGIRCRGVDQTPDTIYKQYCQDRSLRVGEKVDSKLAEGELGYSAGLDSKLAEKERSVVLDITLSDGLGLCGMVGDPGGRYSPG